MRVPPKEGHVINRSVPVFSVCRGGKIFGVGAKRRASKHSANVELQVCCFCKGRIWGKDRNVKPLCKLRVLFLRM